jgi:hypothetical protein
MNATNKLTEEMYKRYEIRPIIVPWRKTYEQFLFEQGLEQVETTKKSLATLKLVKFPIDWISPKERMRSITKKQVKDGHPLLTDIIDGMMSKVIWFFTSTPDWLTEETMHPHFAQQRARGERMS